MASSPAPSDVPSSTTLSPSPSDSALSTPASPPSGTPQKAKLKPEDFQFGGLLGEGSYAKVLYAKQKATGKEYAVKVVDKNFVQRLGKQNEMVNEKRVLSLLDHPCIIKLHYTFQDNYSLYFVLELANNGELFSAISKAGRLNQVMAQFYAAEMVAVLEYLHKTGIIHRDIKPENVLIAEDGHIKLTDFATSKILEAPAPVQLNPDGTPVKRKKSFVGTAEYVSPEQLNDKPVTTAADSWALGCVIYQMLVGKPPFRGESEYLTFQKVLSRDLSFPPFLSPEAKSLIEGLLTVDASARLGSSAADWARVKQHPFFEGIKWDNLCTAPPPAMLLPELRKFSVLERAKSSNALNIDSDDDESVGASSIDLHQLEEKDIQTGNVSASESLDLKKQNLDVWRKFLIDKEEIVFAGMVTKRRGFFAKKRQLLLTSFPRFIYINPVNMELRGSIQWSRELWVEVKNEKVFYIHTPKRDYYMVAMDCAAQTWQKAIDRVRLETSNK